MDNSNYPSLKLDLSKCCSLTIFQILLLLNTTHSAFAGAFGLDEQGAAAMGRANAFSAQADDPSAMFYNPAGIGQLHGTQASLATTLILPKTTFDDSNTSVSTDTESALFFQPTVYVTHEIGSSFHVGVGVFVPFGLSTEWPSDWEGRYVTTFSEINTLYVNPNIAWTPSAGFHVAAGVTYAPSSVTLRNKLELTPQPDGDAEITADGDGWGYNLAILAALPLENTLGLSFRSAIKVDYTGDATFSPLGLSDQATSSLTLPPILTVGLAHHVTDRTTLEADWQWVGWSTVDKITIDFADPAFPIPDVEMLKNWKNSSSFRLGGEHTFGASTLRAGYAFDITPVPDETIEPSLPDTDRHTFTVGFGHRFERLRLDLAYMFVMSKDREVNTTLPTGGTPFVQQGTYSTHTHELGLGVSYTF